MKEGREDTSKGHASRREGMREALLLLVTPFTAGVDGVLAFVIGG